jgi:hypothetical protein
LSIQGDETGDGSGGDGSRGGASSSSSLLPSLRSLFVLLATLTEFWETMTEAVDDWSYFNCRLAIVVSCLVYNSAMNVTSWPSEKCAGSSIVGSCRRANRYSC